MAILIKLSTFLLLMLLVLCLGFIAGVAVSFIGKEQQKENEERGEDKK